MCEIITLVIDKKDTETNLTTFRFESVPVGMIVFQGHDTDNFIDNRIIDNRMQESKES